MQGLQTTLHINLYVIKCMSTAKRKALKIIPFIRKKIYLIIRRLQKYTEFWEYLFGKYVLK